MRLTTALSTVLVSASAQSQYLLLSNPGGAVPAVPGFDPNILSFAKATKSSVAVGELFSVSAIAKLARNFTGPVTIVNLA